MTCLKIVINYMFQVVSSECEITYTRILSQNLIGNKSSDSCSGLQVFDIRSVVCDIVARCGNIK